MRTLLEVAPKVALVVAVVGIVISAHIAVAQTPSSPAKDDLYSLALQASILQMEKEWGHLGHSGLEDEIPTDYRHMIVQKDPSITDKLPTDFEGHSIEYLDNRQLIDHYRKVNKTFETLKIGPIHNEGAVLTIVVSTQWFSYKKHRLLLAVSDWSDVEFRYDCERGAFVISSVKLGGI
jgi:hypothetical protein